MQRSVILPVRRPLLLHAIWITAVLVLGSGCQGFSFGGDPGGGADCLPQGTGLCGPPWDADGDGISTNTETNQANKTASGGFYDFDVTKWDLNLSQARGTPDNGTLFKGMNLTDVATGYIHYNGTDAVDTDDWGAGHMLTLLEAVGRDWGNLSPRMQPGDVSLKLGGTWVDHAAHTNGLDVDVRYVRNDFFETPLNICDDPPEPNNKYHLELTRDLLETFLRLGNGEDGAAKVVTIFIDKAHSGLDGPTLVDAAGHCDHFHVRIQDPDGSN